MRLFETIRGPLALPCATHWSPTAATAAATAAGARAPLRSSVVPRAEQGESQPLEVLRRENELLKKTIASAETAGKQPRARQPQPAQRAPGGSFLDWQPGSGGRSSTGRAGSAACPAPCWHGSNARAVRHAGSMRACPPRLQLRRSKPQPAPLPAAALLSPATRHAASQPHTHAPSPRHTPSPFLCA